LSRAGVITGKIVDEFGDPVTDAQVVPMRYQFVQGSRRLTRAGRGPYNCRLEEPLDTRRSARAPRARP